MKRVRVVFLQDVPNQGHRGEVRDVAVAFAQNVLFPKKLAVIATERTVATLHTEEQKKQQQTTEETRLAHEMLHRLATTTLKLRAKCNEKGALYGSIQPGRVLSALRKSGFTTLTERSLHVDTPIDHTGSFTVSVHYKQESPVKVTVVVEPETA